MRKVVIFCEDSFHEKFVGALLTRFKNEAGLAVNIDPRSARGGLPRMAGELKDYLCDLSKGSEPVPDSIIVVADANCKGYNTRKALLAKAVEHYPAFQQSLSYAIPDPHVERWMLTDTKAFSTVFGRGCTLPAIKCKKDEYKRLLRNEIRASGIDAPLGGEEFAGDIVTAMSLNQIQEPTLKLFVKQLRALFRSWSQ
ncbi:MAG: hypothetical protein JST93_17610 [Acidobacteria bacterium]|nr:hypothetical protein [Acidobacteriota bacterium]